MQAQRGRRSLRALSSPLKDTICFPFTAGRFSSTISKTPLWIKYALIALQRSLFEHLVERKITGNSPENRKSCQDTAINILLLLFRLLGFSLGSGSSLLPGTEDSAPGRIWPWALHQKRTPMHLGPLHLSRLSKLIPVGTYAVNFSISPGPFLLQGSSRAVGARNCDFLPCPHKS